MGYKLNGLPLSMDRPFTDSEGTNYPSNWLRLSTATERAAVPTGGITWTDDTSNHDKDFYWAPDNPKDLDDLKATQISIQKYSAKNFLAESDWMVVRKADAGTAIPTATAEYRSKVRTQCALREATISACSTVEKLCNTIRGTLPATIVGTASNGATEKKKEDGSSYDPVQYNDIANPDLLEEWPDPV